MTESMDSAIKRSDLNDRLKNVQNRLERLEKQADQLQDQRSLDYDSILQELEDSVSLVVSQLEEEERVFSAKLSDMEAEKRETLDHIAEEFQKTIEFSLAAAVNRVQEVRSRLKLVEVVEDDSIGRIQATIAVLNRVCGEAKERAERYYEKMERQLTIAFNALSALDRKILNERYQSGVEEQSCVNRQELEMKTTCSTRMELHVSDQLATISTAISEERTSRQRHDETILQVLNSYTEALDRATRNA